MASTVTGVARPRSFPGGWPLALILIAVIVVLLLAGLPDSTRVAGDGSSALRHGWMQQRARDAAGQAPADSHRDAAPPPGH